MALLNPSFESLYQRHRHQVFRWCLRYGGGSSVWAEDVTHDVFMKLLEQLPRLQDPSEIGGWLYRVTAHLSLKRLSRDRSLAERLVRSVQPPPPSASADQLVERSQDTAEAVKAIGALPAGECVVMLMMLVDGASQAEVAQALSMSKGNVSKIVARARKRLADAGWEGVDSI